MTRRRVIGVIALGLALALAPILGSAPATAIAASHAPTIPLPPDLALETPDADVPPSMARFAGAWAHGAWDSVLPHVLVVEAVERDGRARVVSAVGDYADGNVSRAWRRVDGRIDGEVLTVELGNGRSAVYRLAGDSLRGRSARAGVESRVTLTRAALRDVARVPATLAGVVPGKTVRIPIGDTGPEGQLTLEATLYLPGGRGRHPVVVFNHGSTGGRVAPTATLRPSRQAPAFVERGFAVLAPMRRGRGASDGEHAETEGTCNPDLLNPGLRRAIEDVDAAMAFVRGQPWADPDRIVIAGQSRGGILSVAYAAGRPGAVRAVINFAGDWTSGRCDIPGNGFNEVTFAAAGASTRTPMLWLYAEQDSFYSAEFVRRYHAAFTRAGGMATFRLFPAFDGDGHRLVDRPELWTPAAADFLERLNLPR